jgi:2-amino-4-hydroxy-6-hydroxymethyldihydropteridine diphosphokinase
MQYYEVYLLFGSNLGERTANIANAITRLKNSGVNAIKLSSLYETEPWGNKDQANFINQAGKFHTHASAAGLMKIILDIEREMGRQRAIRWEPRIIDVDILFFGDQVISQKDLSIPHKEMEKRKFALTPLSEIAPGFMHPVLKKNIRQLLAECNDNMKVELFKG